MDRQEALEKYSEPMEGIQELTTYFIKRMGLTKEAFNNTMAGERKTYRDFLTYKKGLKPCDLYFT